MWKHTQKKKKEKKKVLLYVESKICVRVFFLNKCDSISFDVLLFELWILALIFHC